MAALPCLMGEDGRPCGEVHDNLGARLRPIVAWAWEQAPGMAARRTLGQSNASGLGRSRYFAVRVDVDRGVHRRVAMWPSAP